MPITSQSSQKVFHEDTCVSLEDISDPQPGWHVLWTRSNCEKIVFDQLAEKKYEIFLPMINQWVKRRKDKPVCSGPMFKSYLFLRHEIDKAAYLDISKTKGLVNILGVRWDRLAVIPDQEIQSIKQVVESRLPITPYPYLKAGTEVRITRGTLANARGILIKQELSKGIFVVSVNLLHRSVGVKVDCADVVPV